MTLGLTFDKKDCFHLMGLQYLRDRPELNRDRGKVFDEIMNGTIKLEQIPWNHKIYFYFFHVKKEIVIFADHFFQRKRWTIRKIRHHGHFCIRKRLID